ncbi:MAG TPA: TonB family protein [Pyrinomonadaceae bacterium]|nr:TonB family protein [Pyrinomonadaceae bacterium]
MSSAHDWLGRAASSWWPSVADHLWQSAVFVLVVLAATFLVKRGPARVRYTFWLLASAKLLVPTGLFALFLGQAGIDFLKTIFNGQQHGLFVGGITAPVATLTNTYEFTVFVHNAVRHNEMYCALTAIWLAGVITLVGSWVWRRRNLVRVLHRGQRVQSGREWNAFQNAMKTVNLTTDVQLIISRDKTEPTVCGVFRPVLLLPESVAEHLDDDELETIMLHELVHIIRRDNLVGTLQMIVCAMFWFFPPVWFISRKLFDEREQACDEKVLEVYGAPERYATSILKVVRFCFGWKVAGLPGAGGGSNLRRRIDNIMTKKSNSTEVGIRRLASLFVGVTLAVMVAAGVYSSAANTHSTSIVSELTRSSEEPGSVPITFDNYSEESAQEAKRNETAPPQPPQNMQPPSTPQVTQPPSPPQATQPASPPSDMQPPSQPNDGRAPSPPQNTQPPSPPRTTQPAAVPPTPPAAPITPASPQDKPSDKKNEESSQEKKDVRVKGKLIEAPRPEYPQEARDKKIEGSVAVSIVIGEEGKVISAKATSGPSLLHEASVAAAYKARFEPSTVNGKPAKVVGTMTYDFKLEEN